MGRLSENTTRRWYERLIFVIAICSLCLGTLTCSVSAESDRPNLLIVTVDDMNCDSVGVFGCRLPGTTPSIDEFAAQGLRFQHAHVQTGSCYPSRNVMFSGRYSHNTGVEGFYQVKDPDYPHAVDLMKAGGYFVAIRGKVSHSTPYQPYDWDADLTIRDGRKLDMKNPKSYFDSTRQGIAMAKAADKPFFLNVNISDPHKPFYAMDKKGTTVADRNVPSQTFTPEEVPVPGFLFDHPDVRKELSHYYSSVRRADGCFGMIMKALDDSGQRENTVVMFFSDHGMPLPFAKTAVWHHSTHTPWIVRWPGVTKQDAIDEEHMISAVDLLPTMLDIAGIEHPQGFDRRSFLPTLTGQSQSGRDMVYKFHNENSGRNRSPMRSVQSKRFGYIFNPWSDGKRVFKTATTGTVTFRTMQKLAKDDPQIAARLDLFQHGVPEEFYDYQNDPDALHNLIDDPKYAEPLRTHREAMVKFMKDSNDPLLSAFEKRDQPKFVSDYVDQLQAEADNRRKVEKSKRSVDKTMNSRERKNRKQNAKLFELQLPDQAMLSKPLIVTINHQIPEGLGTQKFAVTLKSSKGKRLQRQVESAAGKGVLKVEFDLGASDVDDAIIVSAFVGEDYPSNLLHRTAGPINVTK